MSPILGIWASAVTGGLSTTSFESIATTTVGINGASDIVFSSIPSTYQHLQIRAIARNEEATNGLSTMRMQINSDTGTNYSQHYLDGNGTTVSSGATSSISYGYGSYLMPKDGTLASTYGGIILDFLDYKSTNKYKTIRGFSGIDLAGSGSIDLYSSLWMSTDAITSIKLYFNTYAFKRYSHVALYGIKAAS